MRKLLVVDDEPAILHAFRRAFQEPEVSLFTAQTADEGVKAVAQHHPDVVILDIKLPDRSGLDLLQDIRQVDSRIPVIFITGHGTTETAIEATKRGAYDYLLKPLELDELRQTVGSALEISRLKKEGPVLEREGALAGGVDVLIGRCPAMNDVYKAIGRAAPQDVTVLITGETGTGKELVAKAIYQHSQRSQHRFLAVNCAAIPESLLESELFGHEKGAFTGADRQRIGKFEQCHEGTLFLDEIGDMSPMTQTKILRALADQKFERVGGSETIESDVRVIAATNQVLEKMVASGSFRADLFYRLSVFSIALPPLRERGNDIQLLADHFLKRFNRELNREALEFSPEALELLQQYSWPGNVRELQSVIKQALLQAVGSVLVADFLPEYLRHHMTGPAVPSADTTSQPSHEWDKFISDRLREGSDKLHEEWLELGEHHLLSRVMEHTGGNLSWAARILGINRRTLRSKLRALGIYSGEAGGG